MNPFFAWVSNAFTFEGAVLWLGALATLALYSILYKENPVYRFAEHIFLGLATGYGLFVAWRDVIFPNWYKPLFQEHYWPWILCLVAGAMYYTILSRRLSWMSRLIMMVMMGFTAGLAFRAFFGTFMGQIGASFKPLVAIQTLPDSRDIDLIATLFASFTNILFVVTLLSVMTYFFFSFEHRSKPVIKAASMGRWLMMIAFGAMFGSTVMARMSLFIGRLDFLFREWIPLIK